MALYLLYHLALGSFGVLFKGYREGHWWQYMIAIVLLLLGLCFMYAGKVESVIFAKDEGLMSRAKTTIICQRDVTEWSMD